MEQARIIRIVVASPGDVMAERNALADVIEDLNQGIARQYGLRLELARWETDSYPGFHPEGPQGLIDDILRIEDCDLLIGIFWKRFGSPTMGANSGTEHEIQTAINGWNQNRRPQVAVYFNVKPYSPDSPEELRQWGQVLEFKSKFPKEGMWWEYSGKNQFEKLVRSHLEKFVFTYHVPSNRPTPESDPTAPPGPTKKPEHPPSNGNVTRSLPARLAEVIRRKSVLAIAAVVLVLAVTGWTIYETKRSCTITTLDADDKFLNLNAWIHPPGWALNNDWLEIENSPNIGYLSEKCYRNFSMVFRLKLRNDGGATWALRVANRGLPFQKKPSYYLFSLYKPPGESETYFRIFKMSGDKLPDMYTGKPPIPLLSQCEYTVSVTVNENHIVQNIKLEQVPPHLANNQEVKDALRAAPTHLCDYTDPKDEFPRGSIGFKTMNREAFSITELMIEPMKPMK
ncbi:MAG: hypothetical protein JNK38_10170 [Acidobacteria bacterium]|nr:hypothetical protein [Acidobacteriota bacterium]